MNTESTETQSAESSEPPVNALIPQSAFGGVLMGLANLVPGISGGTMLLVAGVYPKFISAIVEVTKLRFRPSSLVVLFTVLVAAGLAILLGAGTLKTLVLNHRWVMYSIFIGLTLGGVPLVWKLATPLDRQVVIACLGSFTAMVTLAILQAMDVVGSSPPNTVMFLLAGLAGASAMILPGLSGSYILLLMGQYVPILSAVDQFKTALQARDIGAALTPALTVMLPVGIGVVLGVVLVGNAIHWLLKNYHKPTMGLLLGLLLGSIAGLWPFKEGVPPEIGQMIKGQIVTAETAADIDPEDWPTRVFQPDAVEIFSSVGLVIVGLGITMAIARTGRSATGSNPQDEN